MRASTARLMNSPVRLADLTFPQVNRLIHRTRLAFIHLDNLLAFGKRARDGRVDGYITAYLPEECLLLFFRKGEAVNAASLDTTGRQVITITEALKRMRAEVERGELAYSAAPMEQLAWMYQSCAAPVEMRTVDPGQPGAFFAAFARDKTSGILELTSNARVSYVRFDGGRYASGYFCDKPEVMAFPSFSNRSSTRVPTGRCPCSRRPSSAMWPICRSRRRTHSSTPTGSCTGASSTRWTRNFRARQNAGRRRSARGS